MFKIIKKKLQKRFDLFYRHSRLHLILDTTLILVILLLAFAVFSLNFYKPEITFNPFVPNKKIITEPLVNPLKQSFSIEKKVINKDDSVILKTNIKNNSTVEIRNIKLDFISQVDNFIISKITTELDAASQNWQIKNNTISIDKLDPGSDNEVTLKINFQDKGLSSRLINWRVDSEYQANNQTFKESQVLPEIRVAASLNAQALARYHSQQGDQLGLGPIPPRVGFPTTFWVFFNIKPEYAFTDFVMSAKISENITITENYSLLAGTLQYSTSSKQIIWRVKELEAGISDYQAGFEVQLIPTTDQVGEFANLVENIKLQAIDKLTGLKIENITPIVTTDLKEDSINRDFGRIINSENL